MMDFHMFLSLPAEEFGHLQSTGLGRKGEKEANAAAEEAVEDTLGDEKTLDRFTMVLKSGSVVINWGLTLGTVRSVRVVAEYTSDDQSSEVATVAIDSSAAAAEPDGEEECAKEEEEDCANQTEVQDAVEHKYKCPLCVDTTVDSHRWILSAPRFAALIIVADIWLNTGQGGDALVVVASLSKHGHVEAGEAGSNDPGEAGACAEHAAKSPDSLTEALHTLHHLGDWS